jgi:hypothetical protein
LIVIYIKNEIFFKYMYLHVLRARCSGAIVTNLRGANTFPRSSVVASTAALGFPFAIAPLAEVHFAFGGGGLFNDLAVAFVFFLEVPLVC